MANLCDNKECIVGRTDEILELVEEFENHFSTDSSISSFVEKFGIPTRSIENPKAIYARGEIDLSDFEYYKLDEKNSIIKFNSVTAWTPLVEAWEAVLSRWDTLKYYYSSLECGSNICIRHDPYNYLEIPDWHMYVTFNGDNYELEERFPKIAEFIEDYLEFDEDITGTDLLLFLNNIFYDVPENLTLGELMEIYEKRRYDYEKLDLFIFINKYVDI